MDRGRTVIRLLGALLLTLGLSACASSFYGKPTSRIQDPSQRIDFAAFSILPPQGVWYIGHRTPYQAVFGKNPIQTPKGRHTFIALVNTYALEESFTSDEAFLDYLRETHLLPKWQDSRYRNIETQAAITHLDGARCAAYRQSADDYGVPGHAGERFHIEVRGISCIHPWNSRMLIDLGYSQRTPPGVTPIAMDEEGVPFLDSLLFKQNAK